MKQTRKFGCLAEIRLVIWRDFVWLFGDRLPHKAGTPSTSHPLSVVNWRPPESWRLGRRCARRTDTDRWRHRSASHLRYPMKGRITFSPGVSLWMESEIWKIGKPPDFVQLLVQLLTINRPAGIYRAVLMCLGRESNPHGRFGPRDFLTTMTLVTDNAISAFRLWSGLFLHHRAGLVRCAVSSLCTFLF